MKNYIKIIFLLLPITVSQSMYGLTQDPQELTATTPASQKEQCPFCNPDILARQTFYEDDLVLGLISYKPIFKHHSLVIPKRHVERFEDLTEDEMLRIAQVLRKIQKAVVYLEGPVDWLQLQKNGKKSGQEVMHVHYHYEPAPQEFRFNNQLWMSMYMYYKNFIRSFLPALNEEEQHAEVQVMKEALHAIEEPSSHTISEANHASFSSQKDCEAAYSAA